MTKKIFICIFLFVLLFSTAAISYNIFFIPRAVHLMTFIGDETPPKFHWSDLVISKTSSWIIFRYTGDYCDSPSFMDNGYLTSGKNMTISLLVSAHNSEDMKISRKRALNELEFALKKCNPNISGEAQPLLPINMAILFGDEEVVLLLINNNAKMDLKINRKGKEIDGMTPFEFANFLAEKEQDNDKKEISKPIAILCKRATAIP
jgi:ankyrin repeat protein